MSEAHIAGLDIIWEGRYHRQRCAWCGTTLLDYDLERVAVQIIEDEEPQGLAPWPMGAIIRIDGPVKSVLIYAGEDVSVESKAPDACVLLDPKVTT